MAGRRELKPLVALAVLRRTGLAGEMVAWVHSGVLSMRVLPREREGCRNTFYQSGILLLCSRHHLRHYDDINEWPVVPDTCDQKNKGTRHSTRIPDFPEMLLLFSQPLY
jgi:hypothetical protein